MSHIGSREVSRWIQVKPKNYWVGIRHIRLSKLSKKLSVTDRNVGVRSIYEFSGIAGDR